MNRLLLAPPSATQAIDNTTNELCTVNSVSVAPSPRRFAYRTTEPVLGSAQRRKTDSHAAVVKQLVVPESPVCIELIAFRVHQ